MNDTFMKTRPVFPLLLSMALPNVISMLVNSLYNIVDSLFVAQISEQAMTALSLVFPIQNFVNAVAIGFGIGINAQIALYLGAGDHENANRAATHGMMFSLLHGVLGMVLCIAIMPGFLRRFTTDPTLVDIRMCIVIYSILRISQLDCLPKEWCIFTSEKLLYTVATAFLKLSLCILFLIHCRSSITEQVKCHTYHFQAATCLPALLQAFQSDAMNFLIKNIFKMKSRICIYSKAIV